MKIEIWSDVVCPFCYIGKRRLEQAIENFKHPEKIEVEWKSYLLNPDLKSDPNLSLNEYLSKTKGWTMEYTLQAQSHVMEMAKEVGLEYHLDKAVIANSKDAHIIIQLAKKSNRSNEIEELLFESYFTKGLDISDHKVLVELAKQCGLDGDEVMQALEDKLYTEEIDKDIYEASQIGARGVPFFVFDNKYGISGAQPLEVFTRTLEQTYNESK